MSESENDSEIWLGRSESETETALENGSEGNEDMKSETEKSAKSEENEEKEKKATESRSLIWQGEPSLGAFYPFYLVGSLALASTGVAELTLPLPLWTVGVMVPLSLFIIVLPFPLRLAWNFALTGQEAKAKFRLWVGRSRGASLDKATDVVTEQGPIARLLGFGSVRIDTAGTPFPGVKFWGVENPFQIERKVRDTLEEIKDEQG